MVTIIWSSIIINQELNVKIQNNPITKHEVLKVRSCQEIVQ